MRSIPAISMLFGLVLVAGCAASEEDSEEQDPVESSSEALQGGCSMCQIRAWQGICGDVCGGNSGGIHYCYPGMSMREASARSSGAGTCAC